MKKTTAPRSRSSARSSAQPRAAAPAAVLARDKTMPAAVLTAIRRIEVQEIPVPEPGPGEVLVELAAVGVCGSDLHYWRHGRIGDQVIQFPQRLGHEAAGTVVALGPGVTRAQEGQRVAVEPAIYCHACRECRMGRANLCRHVRFLGAPPVHGAYQRYLAMPEECVEPLPDGVDAILGAACEPLGIALHALNLVDLRLADRVAVIGSGPIGLCCMALVRHAGASVVAVTEPRPVRRRVAQALGARWTGAPDRDAFLTAVLDATEGDGADVVLECAGVPEGLDTAISVAARGGRVGFIGIPEVDSLPLDPHAWRRRELQIVHTRRANDTLPRCLRLLEHGDLGLRQAGVFTSVVGLGGVQAVCERLDDVSSPEIKAMVDPRKV